MNKWTQSEAIAICTEIEKICPKFGCHVALTGGLLYGGTCKDLDILFYRIRQVPEIQTEALWEALKPLGFQIIAGFGWCYKATHSDRPVDFFFPEEQGSGASHSCEEEEVAVAAT
jgi:hypothetical protein